MKLKLHFDIAAWNIVNYIQQSMLIPIFIRRHILKMTGFNIHWSARIASGVFIGSNKIIISEGVFVNLNCFLDGCECITIEEFVHVGPHVKMLTGSHTVNPGVLRRRGTSKNISKPIRIMKGSWIGMGAIILPGVTIGEGCVIGAGAVVVHSTEANGLYVGNPARRVKNLPIKANDMADTNMR